MQIRTPGYIAAEIVRLGIGGASSKSTVFFGARFIACFGPCTPEYTTARAAGFIRLHDGSEFICTEGVEDLSERMAVALREQETQI